MSNQGLAIVQVKHRKVVRNINRELFMSRVRRADTTCEKLATDINIDPATLSAKVNNKREFTLAEVKAISAKLKLSKADVNAIFFN